MGDVCVWIMCTNGMTRARMEMSSDDDGDSTGDDIDIEGEPLRMELRRPAMRPRAPWVESPFHREQRLEAYCYLGVFVVVVIIMLVVTFREEEERQKGN
jgi:hypothetical protein